MKTVRKPSVIFSLLYDPKIPPLFIFGALIIAVAGNASYGLILAIIGSQGILIYLYILIGSILVLTGVTFGIKVVLDKILRQGAVGESEAFNLHRKGIIYTAGKQVDTIKLSIENQNPSFIGFLCSQISEPYVDELIKTMGFEKNKYGKKIVDPQNIIEIRAETELIIEWMLENGIKREEIVVDVTGGMTTMSVGAFSMAEEIKVDTQYIKSDFDDKNRPIKNTQKGVFVRRYTDIG